MFLNKLYTYLTTGNKSDLHESVERVSINTETDEVDIRLKDQDKTLQLVVRCGKDFHAVLSSRVIGARGEHSIKWSKRDTYVSQKDIMLCQITNLLLEKHIC